MSERHQLLDHQIGPYLIRSLLGTGATAEVFTGEHVEPLLARKVAIKVLRIEHCQGALVERFMTEARALGRIRHPNVVDIFEVARLPDGRVCLVMELLHGTSLQAHIRERGRLSVHDALAITAQIASGMHAAHRAGIVHRDLKPDNVNVSDEPDGVRVRILDFGVAKLLDGSGEAHTGTSTTLGTASYMAPEQFKSARDVDARADIYALGCVLFEMLTGGPPYPARFLVEQIARHAFAPIPSAAEQVGVSPILDGVLARMLAKDPADRFASMELVLAALTSASHLEGVAGDDATILTPMDPAAFDDFAEDAPLADRTVRDAASFSELETAVSVRALAEPLVLPLTADPTRTALSAAALEPAGGPPPGGPPAGPPAAMRPPLPPVAPMPEWRAWRAMIGALLFLVIVAAIGARTCGTVAAPPSAPASR